jgi:hypothetical protein
MATEEITPMDDEQLQNETKQIVNQQIRSYIVSKQLKWHLTTNNQIGK